MLDQYLLRIVSELRSRGLRVTPQRLNIARIVLENIESHPSFTEILLRCRREMPGISSSTVYNTLRLLEELGMVKSFCVAGETVYDKAEPHVNVVERDGRTWDAPEEVSKRMVEEAERLLGRKVRSIVVYVE